MAFIPSNSAPSRSEPFEKAAAWLNLYLPSKTAESGVRKLGAIGLKASNAHEAQLIEWLTEGDEERRKKKLAYVMNNLIVDFRVVDQSGASGFDLPEDVSAEPVTEVAA